MSYVKPYCSKTLESLLFSVIDLVKPDSVLDMGLFLGECGYLRKKSLFQEYIRIDKRPEAFEHIIPERTMLAGLGRPGGVRELFPAQGGLYDVIYPQGEDSPGYMELTFCMDYLRDLSLPEAEQIFRERLRLSGWFLLNIREDKLPPGFRWEPVPDGLGRKYDVYGEGKEILALIR